jgi:hypothetical protein
VEGGARQLTRHGRPERLLPPVSARCSAASPSKSDVPGHDDVGREEPAAAAHEAPDQRGGDAERRVGHHPERPPREPQVDRVYLHHRDRSTREPIAQLLSAAGVELEGDNARAEIDQRERQPAGPGTDVEDEIAGSDSCRNDKVTSPVVIELMPSPARPPFGGHDAP